MRSLRGTLETALAIVICRSASAMALSHAIVSVEAYGDVPLDEKGSSHSLILQFFLTKGAGGNVLNVAQDALSQREDEAINDNLVMENVKASQALKQKCTIETFELIDMDELLNHLNATSAILSRNKPQKPLSTIKQHAVQHEFQQLQNNVTLFIKQCLREQANSTIDVPREAVDQELAAALEGAFDQSIQWGDVTGMVPDQDQKQIIAEQQANTVSDQDKGELGIAVAGTPLTLAMLREHLSARPVCTHRVWQREFFKHLQDLLAQHMEQSALMNKRSLARPVISPHACIRDTSPLHSMTCRSRFGSREQQLWFKARCSPLRTGRAQNVVSLCHVVQWHAEIY